MSRIGCMMSRIGCRTIRIGKGEQDRLQNRLYDEHVRLEEVQNQLQDN